MFDIAFESAAGIARPELETDGKITIADHCESFTASHTAWDRGRYERQWREAADRVLAGHPGCFVIDLASSQAGYRGECWIAWPEADIAVIQNQLILGSDFDPNDPDAVLPAVPQRLAEDGERVSTWRVRLDDIAAWRERQPSP